MADALIRKRAIDDLVERELQEVRKQHPQLDLGECYSRLFSEFPELYKAYTQTTAIASRNADA
jgi:hypothetical protein